MGHQQQLVFISQRVLLALLTVCCDKQMDI
jgi:hypothetical protein